MGLFRKKWRIKPEDFDSEQNGAFIYENDEPNMVKYPYFFHKDISIKWISPKKAIKLPNTACHSCGCNLEAISSEQRREEMESFRRFAEDYFGIQNAMMPFNLCYDCSAKILIVTCNGNAKD